MDDGSTLPCWALAEIGQSGTPIKAIQAVAVSITIRLSIVLATTSGGASAQVRHLHPFFSDASD
jgi:hypothetical protein